MIEVVNIQEKLSKISELWTPYIVARINDTDVKLARVQGEFVWHSHAEQDELFMVVSGKLEIQLRDGTIVLHPGELAVIPRGVEHCPIAREETHVMLIELSSTAHTGDVIDSRTVREYKWI